MTASFSTSGGILTRLDEGINRISLFLDNKISGTIYTDHPSIDDVENYKHKHIELVLDNKKTIRDFYSPEDKTYQLRIKLAEAGAFGKRHDNHRRKKLTAFLSKLQHFGQAKSIDPLQLFHMFPYIVMRVSPEQRPFGLNAAKRVAKYFDIPSNVQCRGELEYDIVYKGDKGDDESFGEDGGHTCFPSNPYFRPILSTYGHDVAQKELLHLVCNNRLIVNERRGLVASPAAAKIQSTIMDFLKDSVTHTTDHIDYEITDIDGDTLMTDVDDTLSQSQELALRMATSNKCTVVIGPAGTGKTRVVHEISKRVKNIHLCAPTGKAARRMGPSAKTVHCLLSVFDSKNNNYTDDEVDDNAAINDGDLVVVDEASMLDFSIAYKLFKTAIKKGLRLMFVGDPFQLPSVEWGVVLDDLIEWAKSTNNLVSLDSVFRQKEESGILTLANDIRDGNQIRELWNMKDVEYISVETVDQLIQEACKYAPDTQIITPTNYIKNDINYKVAGGKRITEGDKVICTKNQEISEAKNGDIGTLMGFVMEKIKGSKRVSRVARVAMEDDPRIIYKIDASDLDHAYAITVHKSQGSEWDTVVLAIRHVGGSFLNRKLIYTSVTRAKRKLIVVAIGKAFLRAIYTHPPTRHSMGLVDSIWP